MTKKVTASKSAKASTAVEATKHVNLYINAKQQMKKADEIKQASKGWLLAWLGNKTCRKLPDGRLVSRSITQIPAATIERLAYTQIMLTISGPPSD
jgi:hypothetical protein